MSRLDHDANGFDQDGEFAHFAATLQRVLSGEETFDGFTEVYLVNPVTKIRKRIIWIKLNASSSFILVIRPRSIEN